MGDAKYNKIIEKFTRSVQQKIYPGRRTSKLKDRRLKFRSLKSKSLKANEEKRSDSLWVSQKEKIERKD